MDTKESVRENMRALAKKLLPNRPLSELELSQMKKGMGGPAGEITEEMRQIMKENSEQLAQLLS